MSTIKTTTTTPIEVKCFVCHQTPRYQCPRCAIHYCSLACYRDKKHQDCSEAFYKEQVRVSWLYYKEKKNIPVPNITQH